MTTMDKLSSELLARVLLNLHGSDRLAAALTCRRWAESVCAPQLLEDIRLTLRGTSLEAAWPVLIHNQRRYRNLQIAKGDFRVYNSNFWTRIGVELRELQLIRCLRSIHTLHSILRQCPKLRSLEFFVDSQSRLEMSSEQLESLEDVRFAVRHLTVGIHSTTKATRMAGTIDHLTASMPDLTSLCLKNCEYRDVRSVLHSFLKSERKLTALSIEDTNLEDGGIISFVEANSKCLRELHLGACDELTHRAFAVISNCVHLRSLSLRSAPAFGDCHLRRLQLCAPYLEILDLFDCKSVSSDSLIRIHEFKKLRELHLTCCFGITTEALCNVGRVPFLHHLSLNFHQCDIEVLRNFTNPENLRSLTLDFQCLGSDYFTVISENFGNLEELVIDGCGKLTDEDGIKLHRLKNLKHLALMSASGFSDLTFKNGLGSPAMEEIFLSNCSLTDDGLIGIGTHHSRLKTLELSDCRKVTDFGVIGLICCETSLKKLRLLSCDLLRGEFLETLVTQCPRLECIEIACHGVSHHDLDVFAEKRPLVEIRNLLNFIRR